MRKEPLEGMRKDPPELLTTSDLNNGKATKTTIKPDETFVPSLLTEPLSYANDVHHHWLSILLKVSAPVDANMLEAASLRTCFAVVDKESKLTDPWRRVINRKVCKNLWEVLDEFGESVLDTVTQYEEKGIVNQLGAWCRHPNLREYKHAIITDKRRKSATDDRELH